MALTYATAVRTARMQAVLDAIDADAGAGSIEIGTTGMAAVLVTIPLADPAGTVASGVLTIDCSPAITANASGTGTAAAARIKDNSGDIIVSGLTVGTSGTHIVLTSTSIVSTEPVTISSFTITEGNA